MVVTKHFAVHSTKYRKSLIKYILNPEKTKQLKLVSDFGMSNYLDFPSYEELVEMYQANLTNNDRLYDSRNDRQQIKQTKIHAHHLIQSFSPEDKLTPEEINRIGYETIKELTGGNFRFIVTTHTDKDHIHNHILINAIDLNSEKKLKWDYAQERNLRMISDRLAKESGAKIIPANRYSHEKFETYRKANHKFELKQRLYFLMENSKNFEDFIAKATALNVEMDFSRKHARFFMTDREMKQVIRGNQLDKRQPYTEDYFREQFATRAIEQRLDFLLPRAHDFPHLLEMAEQLNLTISPKKKHVTFTLKERSRTISIENKKVSTKHLYDAQFFEEYFNKRETTLDLDMTNLVSDFETYQEEQEQDKLPSEELLAAYQDFKEKRDQIQEFEVVLADYQIDKLVKDGIFIKMTYGIKKDGLVFIPNRNLDIHENEQGKSYHVFIRETAQFFIYNKENSDFNRYMRGRELIRQLAHDSRHIPKRRRPNMTSLKEKIAELNLLIELDLDNQSYQEVKDELIKEIAQLDLTITDLQDKVAHLNKVAEVLLNLNNSDSENRRLARYDYAKMNLTPAIKLEQLEKEIEENQNSLIKWIDDYEYKVRRLENFFNILDNTRHQNIANLEQETKLI
ncbi:TPA: SAG1250 family conjugative relaxase [Streptococcus equi subsp. zooepidemicus]|uniref:Relaxase n=2 Tax=Streptococcus TaxID=1301 RepID=A0A6G6AV72_STRSU|nr:MULTISPECIES: SAG1250 family conjugative relaxase [Streptococcus]KIS16982.1 ORF4 relaxase [Streptococcus equi subsp. zooepidemicus Sz4is]NQJ03389.1 relaxase/mobilization nuclease domain-containing protein [Streptococcus suis]MDI6035747.1 SAG1250 family conjugative relaxase [Streptococcus equi subsp. zooepidemicus]NQO27525.1 relaxase/mobilization nuclease domain-containing protein [Streptococcus suis]QID25697.1 relaxase [Streptococcus suis]